MKSKTLTRILLVLFAAFSSMGVVSCSKHDESHAAHKTLYTCGMHPQVVQDHPGDCPICGMRLEPIRNQAAKPTTALQQVGGAQPSPANTNERKVKHYKSTMMPGETSQSPGKDSMGMDMVPVYKDESTAAPEAKASPPAGEKGERKIKYYKSTMTLGEISQTPRKDSMGMDMVPVYEDEAGAADSSTIVIDPVTQQNMGVRTAEVTRGPLRRVIRTVGVVDYNETAQTDVTVKYKGWIEKLYVDATGKEVKKGEPLFEIYSPDLVSAQNEYLLALEAGAGSVSLKESAIRKLKNLDVSQEQIAELERTRTIKKTLRVNAPRSGIVVEKMVVEGQMVDAGMKLYRLADLSLVWVQSQIYEQDLANIKLGQEAEVALSYLPDRRFSGRVTYIYPTVDEKTRTARVRMEFHNPGLFLKPGMFAKVNLVAEIEGSAVLVPDSAVLRSGEKNTVFVALEGGKFDPRTIVLGSRGDGNVYQVVSGLKEGERVVMSGQFMMDSESQLKEAIQKMQEPGKADASAQPSATPVPGAAEHEGETSTAAPSWNASTVTEPAHYVCPMPEHSTIQYNHPGKCPICGMTLIPADKPNEAPVPAGEHESPQHNP